MPELIGFENVEYVDNPREYAAMLERRSDEHTIDYVVSMTECRIAVTVTFFGIFDKTVHVDVGPIVADGLEYGIIEWDQ